MGVADNIILVGFMGTGKTTAGKLTAERLGWRFMDTDALLEKRAGKPVAEIFAQDGEAAFRALETTLCTELVGWHNTVIATGGGIILDPANREGLLRAGLVICLVASAKQIASRIKHDADRPLLAGADRLARVEALLTSRAAIYAAMPHRIDTTGTTPFTVSERIIQLWRSAR